MGEDGECELQSEGENAYLDLDLVQHRSKLGKLKTKKENCRDSLLTGTASSSFDKGRCSKNSSSAMKNENAKAESRAFPWIKSSKPMQFFAFCLPGVLVILKAPSGNSIDALDRAEMEAMERY